MTWSDQSLYLTKWKNQKKKDFIGTHFEGIVKQDYIWSKKITRLILQCKKYIIISFEKVQMT